MSSAPFPSDIMRGSVITEALAAPGAGAVFDYVLPGFFNYELQFLTFQLTASAAVANRNVTITIEDDTPNLLWRCSPIIVQTAGQVRTYHASQLSAPNTIVYPNALQLALPPRNLLRPGYHISLAIDAMDAADQITDIFIHLIRHAMPG